MRKFTDEEMIKVVKLCCNADCDECPFEKDCVSGRREEDNCSTSQEVLKWLDKLPERLKMANPDAEKIYNAGYGYGYNYGYQSASRKIMDAVTISLIDFNGKDDING
ncbi:MAG: hypothetical protein Q4C42_11460 [Clostridia bacterium]|nr:hypothetical protein [Clostridia bacterium]